MCLFFLDVMMLSILEAVLPVSNLALPTVLFTLALCIASLKINPDPFYYIFFFFFFIFFKKKKEKNLRVKR